MWQDVSESRTRRNVFTVLEEEGSEGAQQAVRVAKVWHFAREWRHCELHLREVGSQSHLASIAKRSQQTGVTHKQLDTLTRYRMYAETKTNPCKQLLIAETHVISVPFHYESLTVKLSEIGGGDTSDEFLQFTHVQRTLDVALSWRAKTNKIVDGHNVCGYIQTNENDSDCFGHTMQSLHYAWSE